MVKSACATIFFGIAGCGKSFLGQLFAAKFGVFHYELDQHLTPTMQLAIKERREFTDEMRDEYFLHLIPHIKRILDVHGECLFTQAVYKERHRRLLVKHIPELDPVWITAPQELIVERLMARQEGISCEYASKISHNFEPPMAGKTLANDTDDPELLCRRFAELFPGLKLM